jgi:C-terminal processing protease CtpA/Prc
MKWTVHHKGLSLLAGAAPGFWLILLAVGAFSIRAQQPPDKFEIDRARIMLSAIKDDVKKNYYDPNYHGIDIDARFKLSDDKLKQASSQGQLWGIIAQTLADLNDSHTFFLPPQKTVRTDYGWRMQMVGDYCYVGAVKPGSDAEAKGVKPGDEVLSIDGRVPDRDNLWLIQYLYYGLRPQPGMRLVVKNPTGETRQVDVLAKMKEGQRIKDLTEGRIFDFIREVENEDRFHRSRFVESDDLVIWKMSEFSLTNAQVDDAADKARKRKNLLLDLRGNGGGSEDTLLRLIGNLFDHDVTVGELKRRKETKPLIAKTRGHDVFSGKLVVLVDSQSGSAAELLARVVQLEKRGTVIGDRTAGAVMRAKAYSHAVGLDVIVLYGVSVTDADVVMSDGKSLEKVGVTPDEIRLPAPADLAAKRDPVLAYGASLLGTTISAEKAGEFFPIEWRK